jgi:hypothetical protein
MNLVGRLYQDFFDFQIPVLRLKPSAYAIEDLPGLWRIHWQVGDRPIISTFYTRIDQACLLWGVISIAIFATAQFCTLNWTFQAILWSILTVVGTAAMRWLTQPWSCFQHFRWVLGWWAVLMVGGVVITDLSIFLNWGEVLVRLCPLWLGLNGLGYIGTGFRMRSRAFITIALVHLLGIALLPYFAAWQFLITGLVIGVSVFLVAELQWDSSGTCTNDLVMSD